MAKLTYLMITSLDGYVADEHGKFDWGEPDEEVHSLVNELERPVGTYLLGRRMYDPVARRLAESDRDLSIGGPELAAHAFRAGLIDEYQVFLAPIVVGGGTQALPDDVRVELELLDERPFGNGMVHLRYGVRPRTE